MFKNRVEAGKKLANSLKELRSGWPGLDKVIVLGIPRGGVVVAAEVARELRVPLDVIVVRKLGVPGHEELAFGAVDLSGQVALNQELLDQLNLPPALIETVRLRELAEAQRREEKFRQGKPPHDLKEKVVILVDDGIATGATTQAAVNFVASFNPDEIILATPVIAAETLVELKSKIINLKSKISIVYLEAPSYFAAVGQFYQDFPQTSDEEVLKLLQERK